MSRPTHLAVTVARRPVAIPQAHDFALSTVTLPDLAEGQIHVRNHYLSVDPAMRGWLSDAKGYADRIEIGDVMRAFAVGVVVRSRAPAFHEGDRVMGLFGWQEQAIVAPDAVMLRINADAPRLSPYLGVLGLNGITAYFGTTDVCRVQRGDTVIVSTAAGAVGSCVGQITKRLGGRTIGIAGGREKQRQCIDEFGYDAAIDYRSEADLDAAIARCCPNGVDVYFDNTSGGISDSVLRHIRIGARIAICGTAAIESWNPWPLGERPNRHLLIKRATMRGFLATDYRDRYAEAVETLSAWVDDGSLRYREDVLDGIEAAPGSIAHLYAGKNTGKLLIRLSAAED
ncbi:2-alkenal reductase [Sphingobium chlorophenolicum L-1]|uniref:2-alkenal reductase n=1 Tax=Sphingobium chlorophenolicum L-1 TaxID=690566 RepID=F6EZ89_SPHCR|nr:NADP-dependent oxidoreductase [Sphingobium chlorophenolicum]AEG50182.1 2-alkenal reductase [Sphingobium chlorophenolicum L-1]